MNSDYVVKCIVTASPPASIGNRIELIFDKRKKQCELNYFFFIDWMRNGDAIKSSEKFIIKHDGLLIRNVQESDDGIYTCRAAGKFN